nr:hypothetical protein [Tanacetum cinerariifolium]
GAPVSTDTELGGYMREFETRVRQDTDEIYMRLDDEQNVSDLVRGEVMSLRTTVLGQMMEIRELQAADRRRQTVILELPRADHRRSTEIIELRTALQGQVTALQGYVTALQAQVTALQGQQGLAGDISSPFEELSDIGSPRADDHEHFELPEMLEDPYIEVALQAPPSPDYIPGPEEPEQATPSPDYSPEYVLESDFEAHPEDDDDEDPEEDPVDYLVDGGDDGDDEEESLEYVSESDFEAHPEDDDDEDPEEDPVDYLEEEEHPALADSVVVASTAANQAPSAKETEPFETDESATTPPPHPAYRMTAMISILALVPMPAWTDLEIVRLLAMSSPPASPLSLWSSPPPQIPFPPLPSILSPPSHVLSPAPPPSPIHSLGYRAAMIRLRVEAASTSSPPLQLPYVSRREDRPELTLPPQKRLGCLEKLGFTWTFFLRTKDETSSILRNFITEIENLKDIKVKIIKYDNGGDFKNKEMNDFCTKKMIRREFGNARTPRQNSVAKRRNGTLIEAARTMLADAKLHITFWAEAINTAYHLGMFDTKGDEGYFIGYSVSSKAFRVFNKRTKKVEENLHVDFLENKVIEKGVGPNCLLDIDTLTNSMNYVSVAVAGKSSTNTSGTKDVASQYVKKDVSSLRYFALPNWFHEGHMETRNSDAPNGCNANDPKSSGISNPTATSKVPSADQVKPAVSLIVESKIPTVSSPVPTVYLDIFPKSSSGPRLITKGDFSQKETPSLGNALTLSNRFEDTFEVEVDLSNMETSIPVSPTSTFKIHKDHPKSQIICPVDTPVQTRHKYKEIEEQSFIATIHQKTNPKLLQFCLFLCFLSHEEPKKIFDALKDLSWEESMQEELLQFKIQNVWVLVDCPKGVRPIGTKWVLKNKKDERGIVIRNKVTLVAQGYT